MATNQMQKEHKHELTTTLLDYLRDTLPELKDECGPSLLSKNFSSLGLDSLDFFDMVSEINGCSFLQTNDSFPIVLDPGDLFSTLDTETTVQGVFSLLKTQIERGMHNAEEV